ncbi:MAG: outer membrane protein transport protein [Kofleriaceae bacterium]
MPFMKNSMRLLTSALFLCAGASVASANAFVLNDFSARATGRGDATIATTSDGSSIVYNVAGIAAQTGVNFFVGGSFIKAIGSFTPDATGEKTETDSPMAITPGIYVTARVAKMVVVGLGFHTPFGSRIVWPDNAPTTDEVTSQALRTYFITPSVGLDLSEQVPGLRIGAGIDLVPATVELNQNLYFGNAQGTASLGGNAFGIGGRAGITYTPEAAPRLSLGLVYRSKVKLDFEGDGDFDAAEPFRSQLPPDGPIKTSITLPQSVGFGVAVRPSDRIEVEANAMWMGWSSLKSLIVDLPGGAQTVSPRDYEDKVSIRLGAEYKAIPNKLDVRVGYMYDPTPIPAKTLTAALPDANRHDLTVGASYHFGNYHADLGLLWVTPADKDTSAEPYMPNYKGTFGIEVFLGSVSFGGHFGD